MPRNVFAIALASACLALAGCASDTPFQQGRKLVESGKVDEGLAQLERAVKDSPDKPEYRAYYIKQKEAQVNRLLSDAESALDKSQYVDAEALYRRAQTLEPENARATTGLARIDEQRRHDQAMAMAEASFKSGDVTSSEKKAREVLNEDPGNVRARTVLRRIAEAARANQGAQPALKSAYEKPITLEFRDAPLKSVFEVISKTAGINFVFDREVKFDTKVTIFVRNARIEDAVKLILITNQLDRKVLNENSVLIYPSTPAKIKDYQDLVVRSFYLGNADPKQTVNMLKTVVKSKDLFVDDKLNLLVMRDTPDAVALAEKLIAVQDLAEPEVSLELEVLEVKRSKLTELGIQWPNQFTVLNIVQNPATVVSTATGPVTTVNNTTTTTQLTLDQIKNGVRARQIGIPSPVANLRGQSSDTNLLANPRIRVKNREKAKILIGDRVPVITTTATANVGVSESVSYLDVGLKLDVEPNVYLNSDVGIKVGLEVSNIVQEVKSSSGTLTYQIGTRDATTELRVKDGETQVLAGLINDEDRRNVNKIPGLGDIPLLGRLFSSHLDDRQKTEIVLLITPHIVRNLTRPEDYEATLPGGTDSAVGVKPLALTTGASLALASQAAASGQPGPSVQLPPPAVTEPVALSWSLPSEAKTGGEVVVTVTSLPAAGAKHADFEVVYDAGLFSAGSPDKAGAPGRSAASLDWAGGAASTQIRLKVVGKPPSSGQLRIENLTVQNEAGATVAGITPPAQNVNIVP